MNFFLTNKVVIISGSSKGIGKIIAKFFLVNKAKVLICSRNLKELKKTYNNFRKKFGKNVMMASGNVLDKKFLKELKNLVIKKWSKVDILIANAGDINYSHNLNLQNYKKKWFIKYNFETAKNFVDFFLSIIIKSKGKIIFISSIASLVKTTANREFVKSKILMNKFAKCLSVKLSKKNVNVNIIAPGNIFFSNGNWDKKLRKDKNKVLKYIKKNVPLNRFGSPEDIAYMCLFLASKISRFITGQVIPIDGGQTLISKKI
jgi:3-oxoacyl-[acyl-carrier protein] reductase